MSGKQSQIIIRCPWAASDPVFFSYHDMEWGQPEYDSHKMFEILVLEMMQAGLSWRTILLKRESMRKAFANFEPQKIARFTPAKIAKLLQDPGIIRNRLKIAAVINNAKCYLQLEKNNTSFSDFVWQLINSKPIINRRSPSAALPATSTLSDQLSKQLKNAGFCFVGSTICYAFMQAIGMVNDHVYNCFFASR